MKRNLFGVFVVRIAPLAILVMVAFFAVFSVPSYAAGYGGVSPFYAVWNDETKSMSFTAVQPESGTEGTDYKAVTGLKAAVDWKRADVVSMDLSFTNTEGQSEKIVLGPNEAYQLFDGCQKLESIDNLTNLDTSNCTDMRWMFSDCRKLKRVDVSGFDTRRVTSMRGMFYKNYEVAGLDCSSFDTSNVTDMGVMFYMCYDASEINVSSFDTRRVRSMYFMFGYCQGITKLDAGNFITTSLSTDSSGYPCLTAFAYGCSSLREVDIHQFVNNYSGSCFQNGFTGSYNIEKIVLGPRTVLYTGSFAPCGLGGPWRKVGGDGTVYTTSELANIYRGSASGGTYVVYEEHVEGHYYRTNGTLNKDNVWEVHAPDNRFKAYCLNKSKAGVDRYLDRVEITSESQLERYLDPMNGSFSHGAAPLGSDMRQALITLIYYGWPSDAAGIQQRYGLTDSEYMTVTQEAIWDFVSLYHEKGQMSGNAVTAAMLQAYNELLQQRFANIPNGETYKLFIYSPWDSRFQSMLSIQGLSDKDYGGVEVSKISSAPNEHPDDPDDEGGEGLEGAEFTIYDENGNVVKTITSRADGNASYCDLSMEQGLPLGRYNIKETKAPDGYVLDSNRVYYFEIKTPGEIVYFGKRNPAEGTEAEEMIFVNDEEENHKAGSVSVKKLSESGKPLIEAEFTIYHDGNPVEKIYTDENGIASTGHRRLPLGTYTIKETRAPDGYFINDEEKTFTISEDGQHVSEGFVFTDRERKGSIVLEAKKSFKNGRLKGGEFKFRLLSEDGRVLQEAYNDAEGRVRFKPLGYGADDQGQIGYRIVEVKGDDGHIKYDEHERKVWVYVLDESPDAEKLTCVAEYEGDGAVFENTREPYIEKTINNKNAVAVKSLDEVVRYSIKTVVPDGISNFRVVDELPEVLKFTGRKDFRILVDGVPASLDFTTADNVFRLELAKGTVEKFYGCELEISFGARIRKGADLSPYKTKKGYTINNVAYCVIDNEHTLSTESEVASVVVTPDVLGRYVKTGDETDTTLIPVLVVICLLAAALIFIILRRRR